jgi:YYY domain-containing protein
VALGLRLYGLDWDEGYPYTPHPDERFILSKVEELSPPTLGELDTLFDAETSTWNPRKFAYGSFPLYLLKGVEFTYELFVEDDLRDLRRAGRIVSALADFATVVLVLLLGSMAYGRRVGLLAAALVSIAVIHIQLSHFFAVDTLLTLFSVGALYFLVRVAKQGRARDSVTAGALLGLGFATKVSIAPILGAFVLAHAMYVLSALGPVGVPFDRRWRTAARGLVAGALTALAVVVITQPYMFLDWGRFYEDVVEQSEMVRRIRDYPYTRQYIDTTPYLYHVRQLATWGLGWPLGLVAWGGLVFASLRGMRPSFGGGYIVAGWAVPVAILAYSTGVVAIFAASAIAFMSLVATLPVRSTESRTDVLLLSWVVPYVLIIGSFEVKFLRYLLPITPFLVLFGARMLVSLWDRGVAYRPTLRPWLAAGGMLLIGTTTFYALAYVSIYSEKHPAVRASEWIRENVPSTAVILKEHWEEGLPELYSYNIRELEIYNPDHPQKTLSMANKLASADYLVLYSNRLYGTIPRLPDRYPVSGPYYDLLFSGELGYELVKFETAYPRFLGVSFVDDTFDRPGVFEPAQFADFAASRLSLSLGAADESFSVYDHPMVLVLRNVSNYDAETIRQTMERETGYPTAGSSGGGEIGLMLSTEDADAQREGGTWTDIVRPNSWTSRVPILAWLLATELMALAVLPISMYVFWPLPDRGFLFSKGLGLLAVGLVVWLLASLRWMEFSRASIVVGLLVLGGTSGLIAARHRGELVAFVRSRWRLLLIGEVVFLTAYFSFVMVRMANPDLWHPYRGGEKPMDLAYLNAVLRSSYMPPFDPWFGGGFINYYYWGQFLVAMLIRTTGIQTAVAFNLAVPTFFALTAAGAFSLVYNLAEATRSRLREKDAEHPGPAEGPAAREGGLRLSPIVAGLGGAAFVTVLGNLDGAIQVGHGVWRSVVRDMPFWEPAVGGFDFWRSTRMMAPDPPGFEITEFPFFTFLFADLHAHLIALPVTLIALGLAAAVVLGASGAKRRRSSWSAEELARLVVLGVVVGSLRLVNAWDFPTYLIVGVGAVFLAEYFVHGGLGLSVVLRWAVKSALVVVAGFVAFLPFHLTYETFFNSVESTTNTTVLWQFLAISGLFIFIVGSFFLTESREWLADTWSGGRRTVRLVLRAEARGGAALDPVGEPLGQWSLIAGLAMLMVGLVLLAISYESFGSTVPFVGALLVLVVAVGLKWLRSPRVDAAPLAFVALIVGTSLSLVVGLDFLRVEGDIDRMNSIFKFYLQVWVMLAVASAYMLWRLGHGKRGPWWRLSWPGTAWVAGLGILVISAAVYPVLGTQDRLRDRFDDRVLPLTLDGTAYITGAVYRDPRGTIDLEADFKGIQWLLENVEGSPVVLEGSTETYRWGGRVSIYTGLPSVVGWKWHQQQQRWDYQTEVDRRIRDVNLLYRTENPERARELFTEYGIEYVYVGPLERVYYDANGLEKFEGMVGSGLDRVFQTDQVTIYRVSDGT